MFVRCPVSPSYFIHDDGSISRASTGRFLKPCVHKRGGYLAVSLWENNKGKTWYVHVLVAIAFHGPRPDGHDAAHIDGNKHNNNYTNIIWATRSENERHKKLHGTSNSGQRNGMAKLTDKQASEIKALLLNGMKPSEIASIYSITESHVSNIRRGKRHAV